MGVESFALGADVECPNAVSLGGSITATPDGGVDGINVGFQIGDTSAPEGVESTTTQQWRLLDGSVREIDLPRISAKPQDEDPKASIGATAVFEPVGENIGVTAQPHVSLSAGTNTRGDDALLLSGGVTLPDFGAQLTGSVRSDEGHVGVGLTDYAVDTSNPNEAFGPDDVQVSADSPKDLVGLNDDALSESLGLLKF